MWLRMAEAASADRDGRAKLAEFYAKYVMVEAGALEQRAMLDASLFDRLTSEQLIGQ
jgi:riboflavin biosynthesis pyrimidine reductase